MDRVNCRDCCNENCGLRGVYLLPMCCSFTSHQKPVTNADYICAMTDVDLAKKMSGLESFALTCGGGWPPEKWLDWLRKEVQK